MKLEKLRVIDDNHTPSRAKIKDALVEIPDEVLLKIVSDYNEANGLAPIVEATEENINKFREEGRDVPSNAEDNFAFLTPNSYNGTEGFNELSEKIDYDQELVPFIEANFTTYKNDLPIEENVEVQDKVEEGVYNYDWFKSVWKKAEVGHASRLANILRIAEMLKEEDYALSREVEKIAHKYDKNPSVFNYNDAKEALIKLFKNNVKEEADKEIDVEKQDKMRKLAVKRYNERYGKNIEKTADLPEEWKKKLFPLIESGRIETFKKVLAELADTESERQEKIGKTTETLLKEFKEIYGFNYDKDLIKNFGAKEEVKNINEFVDCFQATLAAFKDGKIDFDTALKYFKSIKSYPSKYLDYCKGWYEPDKTDEEKQAERNKSEEAERNADLDIEVGEKSVDEMKKEISELVKVIEESKNEEWIKYWNEFKSEYMKAYKKGEYTLESYLKQILYLAKYVKSKINPKESASENDDPEEEDELYKETEEKYLKELKESFPTGGEALDAFEDFCEELKSKSIKERVKALRKLYTIISEDNDVYSMIAHIPNKETAKKLFEDLVTQDKSKARELAEKAVQN